MWGQSAAVSLLSVHTICPHAAQHSTKRQAYSVAHKHGTAQLSCSQPTEVLPTELCASDYIQLTVAPTIRCSSTTLGTLLLWRVA